MGTSIPLSIPPLIDRERWIRNGATPDAQFATLLARHINHCVAWRTKVVYSQIGDVDNFYNSVAATTVRARARWRGSLGATGVRCQYIVAQANQADPRIQFVPSGGGPTVTVHAGFGTAERHDMNHCRAGFVLIPISGTTPELEISTINARLLALTIWEVTDPAAGTLGGFEIQRVTSSGAPIYDRQRAWWDNASANLIAHGRTHLLNFGAQDGSEITVTGTTWTNLVDGNAAGTAGEAVYDLQTICNRLRLRGDSYGPKARLDVYGSTDATGTLEVRLRNAANTATIIDMTSASTVQQWQTGDVEQMGLAATTEALSWGGVALQARNGTAAIASRIRQVSLIVTED